MKSQAQGSPVELLFIQPYNDRYCTYTINGSSERHKKKIEPMIEYIQSLVKSQLYKQVYDLMYEFQTFVVDIVEESIIILEADLSKEYEEFVKTSKKDRYDIKKIKQYMMKDKQTPLEAFQNQAHNTAMFEPLSRLGQRKDTT